MKAKVITFMLCSLWSGRLFLGAFLSLILPLVWTLLSGLSFSWVSLWSGRFFLGVLFCGSPSGLDASFWAFCSVGLPLVLMHVLKQCYFSFRSWDVGNAQRSFVCGFCCMELVSAWVTCCLWWRGKCLLGSITQRSPLLLVHRWLAPDLWLMGCASFMQPWCLLGFLMHTRCLVEYCCQCCMVNNTRPGDPC